MWGKNFFDWVHVDESVSESRKHLESAWAAENLQTLVTQQAANLPIIRAQSPSDDLLISELVPNGSPDDPADSSPVPCKPAQPCAEGILSVANWGDSEAQETLRILPPSVNQRVAVPEDYVELPITLRGRDALFLPLDVPMCGAARKYEACNDRVIAAGAEFVGATREGKVLELTFYAPSKATIVLHLAAPPRHLELPERTLEGQYVVAAQTFTMSLPRGAAPDFLRTVKLDMPYTPFVPEPAKATHSKSRAYRFSVASAVRLPLGEGASLATYPPLVQLAPDYSGRILLHVQNLGESLLTLHVDISGVVSASRTLHLEPKEQNDYVFEVHGNGAAQPDSDGLLHGLLHISGGDKDSDLPLEFVIEDPNAILRYRKDFARDGSTDWVLENDRLRLIVSPAVGGSIAGLVEKETRNDIFSAGGGAYDLVRENDSRRIHDTMQNVVFTADWDTQPAGDAIHLHGATPASSPLQLQIEKTLRLMDSRNLQIQYQLSPAPQSESSKPAANLVSEFYFPAFTGGAAETQFCWDTSTAREPAVPQMHCESFTPDKLTLQIPQSVAKLEIRSLNRATISLAWSAGRIAIEQHNSAARVLWDLPRVTPENKSEIYMLNIALGESR